MTIIEKQLQNNIFRFNQQFRKYQRNGKNDFLLLAYLDKQLQNFRFQLNYSYQQVSEQYAEKINTLYDIINVNSKQFGANIGEQNFCTNRVLNTSHETIDFYLYQILQAYQFMTNDSEDIYLYSGVKPVLENVVRQIQLQLHQNPDIVQFTSLIKGNIYQLRSLNQNDEIDLFNNQQANGYNQNQPWFRDFFGTANDDILIIVDCSNIYSNLSRQGIMFTVQQFLQQISPSVNVKILLLAEEVLISSQSYVNLNINQEYITKFVEQIETINLGQHIPEVFFQEILKHEIEEHNLYHNVTNYKQFQPFKLLNAYVFIGSLYSSDQYELQAKQYDGIVTFIKYQKNFITLKSGLTINLQQRIKTLALLIKQSNARFILIHSRISDYLQQFHQRGITDYITIYCTAEVMPWYYSFCDNLNIQNQQNRELIVLLSVQQILENLQPNEGELMITSFKRLTLFSVPVYVTTPKGMYYLSGFLTVAMNIDNLFKERREILQHGNVVSVSHDVGQIVRPELIIQNENNTQFLVQDQYLHVVDTLQTDSKFQLRATFVMDQVLNYSNDQFHISTINSEDCLSNYVTGYFICFVEHTQEFYFDKQLTYNFYIMVNESLILEGVFDNQTQDETHKIKLDNFKELINESSYNTQLRLIASFLGDDQYFANKLYTNKNYYEYQIHPHLICSIDKVICGFTSMKIINQFQINLIIERLLNMQEANKNTANYTNYTSVMYFQELRKLYVVQRHYVSLNVMKLYANSTFLLRLVCVPMPDLQQLFLADCYNQSKVIQQSVYFVDFDGNVQYQISCINNQIYIYNQKRNIEQDSQLIDLYLLMLTNQLYNATTKQVQFLTSQFKNNLIYMVNMLQQLNGSGVYEQFEGSLLMMAVQIYQSDMFEYKILLQQSYDRNVSQTKHLNQTTIISNFDPIYNFQQYKKRTPFKNQFDNYAKQFYLQNQQLFEDQQQDVTVFEFPTVHVVVSLISLSCLLLLYFI